MMTSPHDALIVDNLDLVPKLARKLQLSPNSRVWDDAIQAGRVGLIDAATRYDPSLGVPFRGYASKFVLGAIKDELSDEAVVRSARGAASSSQVDIDDAYAFRRVPDPLVDAGTEDRAAEEFDRHRRIAEVRAATRELPDELRGVTEAVLTERDGDHAAISEHAATSGVSERKAYYSWKDARAALRASLQRLAQSADTASGAKGHRET